MTQATNNEHSGANDCYACVLDAAREIDKAVGGVELARMPKDVAKLTVKLKRWIQDGDLAAETDELFSAAKYDRDMDSIRAAMAQTIESYDTYSTIADKEDEARLDGMRSMLTLFDVQRRMCESR